MSIILFLAQGNPDAKLMIIGEAPGRQEEEQAMPFVGKSGIIAHLGHFLNIIKIIALVIFYLLQLELTQCVCFYFIKAM